MEKNRSIGKWISILYRQAQIYINQQLKDYNVNSSEYIYLITLAEKDGVNQKYLSDILFIDESLTTRVIRSLVKKGFVEKEKSTTDKRSYLIKLTQQGKKVIPVIGEKLAEWTKILAGDRSEPEINQLIDDLAEMSKNALLVTKGDK